MTFKVFNQSGVYVCEFKMDIAAGWNYLTLCENAGGEFHLQYPEYEDFNWEVYKNKSKANMDDEVLSTDTIHFIFEKNDDSDDTNSFRLTYYNCPKLQFVFNRPWQVKL